MRLPLFTRHGFLVMWPLMLVGSTIKFPTPSKLDLAWLRSSLNAGRRATGQRYATSTDRASGETTVARIPAESTPVEVRQAITLSIPARLLRMRPGEVQFIPGVKVTSVRVAASALHAEYPVIRYKVKRLFSGGGIGVSVACTTTKPPVEPRKTQDTPTTLPRWRGLVAIIGADAIKATQTHASTLPSRVIATIHAKDADSAVVAVRAPNRATAAYWQGRIAACARSHGGAIQTDTVRSVLHASS